MSTDLTPANHALVASDPLERVRQRTHADFTPSLDTLIHYLAAAVEQLVQAEECPHPTLSREGAVRRAAEWHQTLLDAIKVDAITTLKCRRGEWVATA